MNKKRQVFFNCNHLGELPVSVAVYSLLKSADPSRDLHVFVAHDSGFAENGAKGRVQSVVDRFAFARVTFINFDPIFAKYADRLTCELNQWTSMVWALCCFPELIPDITDNLVFLDWDTFVYHDLGELYDMDLSTGNWIGAAVSESLREHRPYLVKAGWPESAGYSVNYGVQVIDTAAYRREHVMERMLDWYAKNKNLAVCAEQDALNVLFGDRIRRLPPKYNLFATFLEQIVRVNPFGRQWRVHPTREVFQAVSDPSVVHFIGRKKPWRNSFRSFRSDYRRAMREIGFTDPIPGETAGDVLLGALADAGHSLLRMYARVMTRLFFRQPSQALRTGT